MRFCILPSVLLLAACGASSSSDSSSDEIEVKIMDPRLVSKAGYEQQGKRWPLTVEMGRLGCTQFARWIEVDGQKYGLNGVATEERGFAEIEPIWADDETTAEQFREAGVEPVKVSIGDMIEEAGRYCQ